MATVHWHDGFELYDDTTDLFRVYTAVNSGQAIETTNYRTGAQALKTVNSSAANYGVRFTKSGLSESTKAIGLALKVSGFYASSYNLPHIQFIDSSGNVVLRFCINIDGKIECYRGSTLLGTTTNACVTTSSFNYIEIKVFADNSSGTVEIRLNGDSDTPELSLSGIDTIETGTTIGGFDLYSMRYKTHYWDDLYFADDFLGDCKVDPIRVTGAGNYSQFTPSAGSNYENVDESPGPDDDTTYNDGDAVDEIDTYEMGDISEGGVIHAFKAQGTFKKTDAGTAKCKHVLRINGSDYLGDEKTLGTSYTTEYHIWNTNPDDSAAFETADINALELGCKVTELT